MPKLGDEWKCSLNCGFKQWARRYGTIIQNVKEEEICTQAEDVMTNDGVVAMAEN